MLLRGVITAGIAAVTLSGGALAAGGIGGPPTISFDRCDRFIAPCGDPIVLGRAKHFNGRTEIIGMRSRFGLCQFFDNLRQSSGHGSCGASPLPPEGKAMSADGFGFARSRRGKSTQITGSLVPEVARVRVRYRRNGERKQRRAAVVQVEGELQERLEEPEPFGILEVTVRGCIPPKRFRLAAFDSAGRHLGTARRRGGARFCRPHRRLTVARLHRSTKERTASGQAAVTHGRRHAFGYGW